MDEVRHGIKIFGSPFGILHASVQTFLKKASAFPLIQDEDLKKLF